MKLGVQIADFHWHGGTARSGQTLAELAQAIEAAGFDLIGVADHLWQGDYLGGVERPEFESMVTLGALATLTTRCRLVPLVAGVHFRQPALLAKSVTTVDVLSGGRAMLGIGAGWYEEEVRGLGFPFPPLKERFEMLEEAIQICLQMWQGEHGDERPFVGKHYQLERPLNSPQSLSRPHPPILIGGSGERVTLRLVARYADASNLYPTPDLAHKLDVLRRHCDAEGRDYDAIEKTCMFHYNPGPEGAVPPDLAGGLRELGTQGIDTVIGIVRGPDPVGVIERLGREVVPEVAAA